MRQHGFTMVELIVTMIIIGILAIAVLPRMDLLRGFDEIGYRDQVKATLEYARKSAVAGRRYVCVTRSTNDLILTRNLADPDTTSASCGSDPLALPGGTSRYCPSGSAANRICAPSGVTFGTASTAALIFSPLGVSAGGSYTIIVNSATTATITVEAETGYVH
jgi:MSHA pilin protein MshC